VARGTEPQREADRLQIFEARLSALARAADAVSERVNEQYEAAKGAYRVAEMQAEKEARDAQTALTMAIMSAVIDAVGASLETVVAGRAAALAALQRAQRWLLTSADAAKGQADDWLAAHCGDPLQQAYAELLRKARELILQRRFA